MSPQLAPTVNIALSVAGWTVAHAAPHQLIPVHGYVSGPHGFIEALGVEYRAAKFRTDTKLPEPIRLEVAAVVADIEAQRAEERGFDR